MEKMLINERFKSPNKEFEKVYILFNKKDYFDENSQVKKKQEEFARFLKKGDPMATKVFKQHKEDMKSSLSFIEDMVRDYNKKNHFEAFQIFSKAVNNIEMKDSKSAEKSGNFIKSKIHNNSQKYSLAIYTAIRKQKFSNYKDVHKDVDELISKNEGFSSDAQRKAAFANGYEEKGKKKNESVNEGISKDDIKIEKSMTGFYNILVWNKGWQLFSKHRLEGMAKEVMKAMNSRKGMKYVEKLINKQNQKSSSEIIAKKSEKNGIARLIGESVNEVGKGSNWAEKYVNDTNLYKKLNWYIKMGKGAEKKIKGKEFVIMSDGSALIWNTKTSDWELYKPKRIDKKTGKPTYESVNEGKYNYKADALTAYFKGKIDAKELDKIARDDFKSGIATKKELSNFLSNKFTQDVMSDTYGIPAGTLIKRVRGLMKFAEGKDDGVPQGYNPVVEDKKQIKDLVKKVKHEKLFYDVLDTMEKKYGKRKYRIWLEKSLKDFGVNPKKYDYRTNAGAEEKLFQLGK